MFAPHFPLSGLLIVQLSLVSEYDLPLLKHEVEIILAEELFELIQAL